MLSSRGVGLFGMCKAERGRVNVGAQNQCTSLAVDLIVQLGMNACMSGVPAHWFKKSASLHGCLPPRMASHECMHVRSACSLVLKECKLARLFTSAYGQA
eukprot:1145176-Pelagomonas_calceolata.AAC.6